MTRVGGSGRNALPLRYTGRMGNNKSKRKRKRRRRGQQAPRKKGGVMLGMRSGFKGIADSVTGKETNKKYKWWGNVITVLLLVAAVALLASQLN